MFVKNRITASLISALLLAITTVSVAQQAAPATENKASAPARDPKPIEISVNDPAILISIKKARATLDQFLPIAAKNDPNNQAVSLKIAIHDGKKVEHLWVTPFTQNGKDDFSGTILDKPAQVLQVKQGQQWAFTRKDVVDWMYYDTAGRKMHGNYSTCAKLTKGPKADRAEMKRVYGLDCSK
jgi:uncharacterized protein YegJ (DUF2314 family)